MNVGAWLRKPNIATIPLFMAGDKHFFLLRTIAKKNK